MTWIGFSLIYPTQCPKREPIVEKTLNDFFQVCRLPLNPQSGEISQGLVVTYATKEKKQKSIETIHMIVLKKQRVNRSFFFFTAVMRLGKKKEKDRDQEKEQFVDGVARLICSPNSKQSHPIPLRGIAARVPFKCISFITTKFICSLY